MTSDMHDRAAAMPTGLARAGVPAYPEGVTVVTLSYRRPDYFTRLADSLPPCGAMLLERILVWNGGDRETAEAAERRGWTVLRGSNRSFAAGCNDAVAASASSHVLLLSDDAEVTPATLAALWARRAHLFVAPVIVNRAGRVNSAGGGLDDDGNPVHLDRDAAMARLPADPRACRWATGAALMLARQLWDALGGFDEAYPGFGGYEDVDLGLRASERGVDVHVATDAVVIHDEHGTRSGCDEGPNRRRFVETWHATGRLKRLTASAA